MESFQDPTLPFAFSCGCEPTTCSLYKWNLKMYNNKSQSEIMRTLGSTQSRVCFILRNKKNLCELRHPLKTAAMNDHRIICHGKDKALCNIQPSAEHFPGGRDIIVQVYFKETTSKEQAQRIHHKVQTICQPWAQKGHIRHPRTSKKVRPAQEKHTLDGSK